MKRLWRHDWTSGLAVQALGPLCAFATVFLIAHTGGVVAQGRFAQARAWVDLLVVFGCFGFPQSFVYVINKLGASTARIGWGSVVYSAVFFGVAWGLSQAGAHGSQPWVPALAAALFVLHGLWRGVFLTARQGLAFAAFTVLPAVSLLVVVAGGIGAFSFDDLILASAVPTLLIAALLMAPLLARRQPQAAPMPWRALMANGAHVFVQALLTVAQPLVAYALLRHAGAGDAGVGLLHVGVFLVQGASVPVSMLAPLLFARWTSAEAASPVVHLDAATPRWLRWGAVGGAALATGVALIVPSAFGPGFEPARWPAALMMLTLPMACHARLVAPALHASGHPQLNTEACLLRLSGLSAAGWGLLEAGVDPLWALAAAWTFAEGLGAAWTLWLLRRLLHREAAP